MLYTIPSPAEAPKYEFVPEATHNAISMFESSDDTFRALAPYIEASHAIAAQED